MTHSPENKVDGIVLVTEDSQKYLETNADSMKAPPTASVQQACPRIRREEVRSILWWRALASVSP